MGLDLEIHHVDETQAVATCGVVVMRIIVTAPTRVEDIDRLLALVDVVLERSPAAGLWVIAHHGAPIPPADVRRHTSHRSRLYEERLCFAMSMLGLGFWASAAYKATVALTRFTKMTMPIEPSVTGGARRLCMELVGIDPAELVSTYDEVWDQMSAKG